MNVAILGARERDETPDDKQQVDEILIAAQKKFKTMLHVVSVGCDRGIGKWTKLCCMERKIIFVEIRVKFEGEELPKAFFGQMFEERNRAAVRLGDEFHVFLGPRWQSVIEGLVPEMQQKVNKARVHVYPYPEQRENENKNKD